MDSSLIGHDELPLNAASAASNTATQPGEADAPALLAGRRQMFRP